MKVYTYCEYNGCKNTGKPIFLGYAKEYLTLLSTENLTIVAALGEVGDFSGSALCLGYFDGVHIAHRKLFEKAKEHGAWGVLLLDRNVKNMPLLTTMYEKVRLIEEAGADYVIIAEFTESFMNKTPEEFAEFLAKTLKVSKVVAGYDYRFGKQASGNAKTLVKLSEKAGFSVEIVDAECVNGEPIKSTAIREYIKNGEIQKANALLGYDYIISGIVEKGLRNGHKLGFPTANIAYSYEKLLPADGVYCGRIFGKDAVVNVGKNPTFDAARRTVEVHIPDFDGDLYGKHIEVTILEKIRDDIKFKNMEDLISRIKKDIEFVKGR